MDELFNIYFIFIQDYFFVIDINLKRIKNGKR